MSGNSSRYSHQRQKRYVQANLVQGAMVTDADQMESQSLARRNTTTLGDVAIRSGVPKTDGILTYATQEGPADVVTVTGLVPGRVVADGHVGRVRLADEGELGEDPGLSLLTQQADLLEAPAPEPDTAFCVFADLWGRHVGPAEDARLVDAAFLSAETSVRVEQMAQLKFARIGEGWTEAELRAATETDLPIYGDLRLVAVDFENEVIDPDECDPCATTLTDQNLDAGNHLFRLEVHRAHYNQAEYQDQTVVPIEPSDQTILVKFGRDNGSVEVPASSASILLEDEAYENAVFELADPMGEQRLGLYSDGMDNRVSGLFSRADIEAQLGGNLDGLILRVWDGAVELDLSQNDLSPVPVGPQSAQGSISRDADAWEITLILGGLSMTLTADARLNEQIFILPGDAWCVEIREYADENDDRLIWEPEPVEAEHHYTFLGRIQGDEFVNEELTDLDIRSRAFPALTEITAQDVSWSNHHHTDIQANTVQGAIDLLFGQDPVIGDECLCTYCIELDLPLADQLETINNELLQIGPEASALICFPAGTWVLDRSVRFERARSVTLRGAGMTASVIDVQKQDPEAAITAANVGSFAIEDLGIECSDEGTSVSVSTDSVGFFRMLRTLVLMNGPDNLSQVGVAVGLLGNTEAVATTFELRDSLFVVGLNSFCVFAGVAPLRSIVENCVMIASDVQSPDATRRITAASNMVASTAVLRSTAAREELVGQGRFFRVEGSPGLIFDMEAIPERQRPAAVAYWNRILPMMRGGTNMRTPAAFNQVRESIHRANWAMRVIAEAEIDEVTVIVRTPPPEDAPAPRFAVLSALIGANSRSPGIITLDDIRIPSVSGFSRHVTGPAIRRSARREAVRADGSAPAADSAMAVSISEERRREIEGIFGELVVEGVTIPDFADGLGDLVANPATPSFPTVGLLVTSNEAIQNHVVGNRFLGMDVAIGLRSAPDTFPEGDMSTPHMATVRDNFVSRSIRSGIIGSGFGDTVPNYAITLWDMNNVTVENNTIEQTLPDGVGSEIQGVITSPNLDPASQSWAAIGLQGQMGPKARIIGNSAHNFRHCVYILSEPVATMPVSPADEGQYPNHWLIKENSAFPVVRGSGMTGIIPQTVDLINQFRGRVRISGNDNHPESNEG